MNAEIFHVRMQVQWDKVAEEYYWATVVHDSADHMIYLLTAVVLSPGGSTHLHTNNTQNNTNNNQIKKNNN
jgi:hypothetical protein